MYWLKKYRRLYGHAIYNKSHNSGHSVVSSLCINNTDNLFVYHVIKLPAYTDINLGNFPGCNHWFNGCVQLKLRWISPEVYTYLHFQ